jgi:hypothetical protein
MGPATFASSQYATSSEDQRLENAKVATLQYGAQAAATSRASLRLTTSPEKWLLADAFNQTSIQEYIGAHVKIRASVQRPMPRIATSVNDGLVIHG